jgi:hypothetical protein
VRAASTGQRRLHSLRICIDRDSWRGGTGAGKGAAIGGVVGAGSHGGLNENEKHDEAYRAAYARCMASHGYRSGAAQVRGG